MFMSVESSILPAFYPMLGFLFTEATFWIVVTNEGGWKWRFGEIPENAPGKVFTSPVNVAIFGVLNLIITQIAFNTVLKESLKTILLDFHILQLIILLTGMISFTFSVLLSYLSDSRRDAIYKALAVTGVCGIVIILSVKSVRAIIMNSIG